MNSIFTFICEGLRLGLIGKELFNFVQNKTNCTEEQFKTAYAVILEAYLK